MRNKREWTQYKRSIAHKKKRSIKKEAVHIEIEKMTMKVLSRVCRVYLLMKPSS